MTCPRLSRPVKKTPNGRGDRIIRLPAGSANLGFALTLRLRAGSRTKVLILSQKSGRQDSNSEIGADNQELASKDAQRDSQNRFSAPDTDLQAVISAWDKLPASLRAAVVAIVSSSHSG